MVTKIFLRYWKICLKVIKINSISDIVDRYDNFIIDQWGVMHDGTSGYIHAIKTINYLKK